MKNMKFGFQFGIGFFLASTICGLPVAILRYPEYKKQFDRALTAIRQDLGEKQSKPKMETHARSTSAFPPCKNKIGFTIE